MGRPIAPPDWAYGVWMCMQGGQDLVSEQVEAMEAAGIQATVLWVQDWTGRRAESPPRALGGAGRRECRHRLRIARGESRRRSSRE